MSKWNYGGAIDRHPIDVGQTAIFDNGSMAKVHNLFDGCPVIMKNADLIFVDPPWNIGNINTFYTKADRDDRVDDFASFYKQLFTCIADVNPKTCYVEIGKQHLADFILQMRSIYKYVTFYNSTYYNSKDKLCYVVRGSHKSKKPKLDHMDEEKIIEWVCENEEYECIGDLCMGRGLVGWHAWKNDKRFVGTELNKKRLAVLLERIYKNGGHYQIAKGD